MKLTAVFLTVVSLGVNAKVFSQTVTWSGKNVSIERVFSAIERQTGYTFFYNDADIGRKTTITLSLTNTKLNIALDKVLEGQDLDYTIQGKTIFIRPGRSDPFNIARVIPVDLSVDVHGKVTDRAGNPLVGVTVVEKGTANGTTTDGSGNYQLTVTNSAAVLIFSYIGYEPYEEAVSNRSVINIALEIGANRLTDVVVTALGIKRQEKALGYSVAELKGSSVSDVQSPNMVDALSGKVAGVNIRSTSPDPGASVFVNIRGQRTLYGEDQPLIVLDGVPMNNSVNADAKQPYGGGSGNNQIVDYGNPMADIDPNNVASISVLRGAAAAALYGSRAGNGVILITTKDGSRAKKGIGVSINSSVIFDKAWQFPKFQNMFGSGNRTGTDDVTSSAFSWGPRLNDGSKRVQWDSPLDANGDPIPIPWVAYPDRVKDFYQTGSTITNNVALTGANNEGNFRLSYTNMKNKGIVPNTDLKRDNVTLAAGYALSPKVSVKTNIAYIRNGSDNRPTYNRGSVNNIVYVLTPNVNIQKLRNYWVPGKENIQQYSPLPGPAGIDNPYFVAYESINGFTRDRLTGNIQLTVDITPNLSVMGRTGLDYYAERRESRKAFSSDRYPDGAYSLQNLAFSEQNSDFLITYKKTVNTEWFFSISGGANRMDQNYSNALLSTNQLVMPGLYSIGNAKAGTVQNLSGASKSKKRINSVYGIGQVAYKDLMFLDLSARNDWTSTLPPESDSYFYPSASLSAIVTDILHVESDILSFAKLRVNWSQVGNDVGPYSLYNTISLTEWDDVNMANISSNLANNLLKPEISTSLEFGTNLRLFKNRVGLDVTWYQTNTVNQHINIPTTGASGYTSKSINAGQIRNQGLEITLNATPVNRAFRWDVTATYSRNHNKVIKLTEGITQIQLGGAEGVNFYVSEGSEMGDFYGRTWEVVPDGPYKGQPLLSAAGQYQTANEYIKIGNYNPDFMIGFTNHFSYKGFSLSALLDWRQGGQFYSYVAKNILSNGLTTVTVPGRDAKTGGLSWTDSQGNERADGMIMDGYLLGANGEYVKNTIPLEPITYYGSYYWDYPARSTFSASYVKLREVSLDYTFSKKLLQNIPITNLTVGFIARNLFSWTAADVGYDPETSMVITNGSFIPGVGGWTLPNTRSYGFKIGFAF